MMMTRVKTIDRGHRDWYQLERWRVRSRYQLAVEPLCAMCLADGKTTPATIADHIEPHRGDWNAFLLGKLQSLCRSCHDGGKRQIERKGFRDDIGPDGMPLDPNHPVYARKP